MYCHARRILLEVAFVYQLKRKLIEMLKDARLLVAGYSLGVASIVTGPILLSQKAGGSGRPPAATTSAGDQSITPTQLKTMFGNMGYEPEEIGKGTYEIKTVSGNMTVYVVANLSQSGNKIWLSVNLGELSAADQADAPRLLTLLRKNAELQPAHFFVSGKSNLRIGMPVENKSLSAPILRKSVETLTENVFATRELWLPKAVSKKPDVTPVKDNP
jgi:hypothetical protein